MKSAFLTTISERREALKETVESLLPQVDKLFVYLHGYASIPEFLDNPKITVTTDIEYGDRGDLDKFFKIAEAPEGFIFTCDDDLIYPPDYCDKTIAYMGEIHEKYSLQLNEFVVSHHGSIPIKLPIANYYQDRYTFPCLDEVRNMVDILIPGTGVMCFHSSVGVGRFETKSLRPNMADINFAIWALDNKLKLIGLPHDKGWIRHSDKVNLERTIAAYHYRNPFEQTRLINSRGDLFQTSIDRSLPLVSIVVATTRLKTNPEWVKRCYDSIREQTYPNIDIRVVDNPYRIMTIGKSWNEGVKQAKGEYVLFLADDDYISPSYVSSLVALTRDHEPNIVCFTSYLMMFQELKNGEERFEAKQLIPTGMWKRDFLLKEPFKEFLTRYVDTDIFDRAKALGYGTSVAHWEYGYFYRSHVLQTSGMKDIESTESRASEGRRILSEALPREFNFTERGLHEYEVEVK